MLWNITGNLANIIFWLWMTVWEETVMRERETHTDFRQNRMRERETGICMHNEEQQLEVLCLQDLK